MKIKLSEELPKYSKLFDQIDRHFIKNEATPENIATYSGLTGVPLFVIYVYLIQIKDHYELRQDFFDICDYYEYENDVII